MDFNEKFYSDMSDEEKKQTILKYQDKYIRKIDILFNMLNYSFHNYGSIFDENELKQIKNATELLDKLSISLQKNFAENFNFNEFVEIMDSFVNIEKSVRNITYKVFKHDSTNIEDFYPGQRFMFIIHCPTMGSTNKVTEVSDDYINITSTSMITDRSMGLFSERLGNYGYIMDFDLDNFIVSSSADLFSICFPQAEYDNEDYYMQFYKSDEYVVEVDDELFQMSETKVAIPRYIEQVNMDTTIKVNGELLNYDEKEIYNEILLLNNDKLKRVGVFVRTIGDKNFSSDYLMALKLAHDNNLPLIEIDKSLYREKNGLQPLTSKETKKIINSVARRIKMNSQLYIAFQKKFVELYKSYIKIGEKYTPEKLCLKIYEDLRETDHLLNDDEIYQYIISIKMENKEKQSDINFVVR